MSKLYRVTPTRQFEDITPAGGGSTTGVVHTAGDESIDGVKTFVKSPAVPSVVDTDSSTNAANTAFVHGLVDPVVTRLGSLKVATQDMVFYVRKTGSDANDGLTESTAFLTVARALDEVSTFKFMQYGCIIDIGAGTFDESDFIVIPVDMRYRGGFKIRGVSKAATILRCTNSTRSAGFLFNFGAAAQVENITFESNHPTTGISVVNASTLTATNVKFISTQASNETLLSVGSSQLYLNGGVEIESRAASVLNLLASYGSSSISCGPDVALNGSVSYAAVYTRSSGRIAANTTVFSGTVTGRRYISSMNGTIEVDNRGANVIPGTIAGLVETGGQYA